MSKIGYIAVFCVLFTMFSIGYWSFFPGAYSFDTYFSYLNSLGIVDYREVTAPLYVLNWKLFNNYNFAPLLVNYLFFVIALFLSIKFTKSFYFAIFSLIGICLPYTLVTFIFAWKDTALLSIMFLLTALLLYNKKTNFHTVVVIFLFFIAFAMRINAVFAVIPLLYYFLLKRQKPLRAVLLTVAIIIGFQAVNKGLNLYIFKAEFGNGPQSMMYTDIAKINYLEGENVALDIPDEFVYKDKLDTQNVNNIFKIYCNFSCNDVLYMYPDKPEAKVFLHNTLNEEAASRLRNNWLKKIVTNPISYLRIRYAQLDNSLWSESLLYSPEAIFFNEQTLNTVAEGFSGKSVSPNDFDQQSKVFYPSDNSFIVGVREFISGRTEFKNLISYPGIPVILSALIFILFLIKRKQNNFYELGVYVSASGLLYTLAYLFLLPCTDYRYFLWTIFSFWVSLGIFVLGVNSPNIKTVVVKENDISQTSETV